MPDSRTPNSERSSVHDENSRAPAISRKKVIVQIIGFVIGMAMLGWCIKWALASGKLSQLHDASPTALTMLIVCTLVSVVTNGAIFWLIVTPAAPIRFLDVQFVNCVVNLANYLPVRFGMITRIAHHRKVDHIDYFTLFAWYAAVGIIMMLVFGALLLATLVRPAADLWWVLILSIVLAIGLSVIIYIASHHLLTKRLRGADRMLRHPGYLIAAVILRLIDLGAYGGRLYFALSIIGISVSFRDWLYLTLISIISSLTPVGSLGFREFALAYVGPYLTSADLQDQLAAAVLVDRGAEMAVFFPLGIISTLWMMKRWRTAAKTPALDTPCDTAQPGGDAEAN